MATYLKKSIGRPSNPGAKADKITGKPIRSVGVNPLNGPQLLGIDMHHHY
ncbi:hypothetical protein [[Mycoplasma] imitans]|nr:hypothetical protein [[Mycoplasma] imitans]